jgi:hypothetical protein
MKNITTQQTSKATSAQEGASDSKPTVKAKELKGVSTSTGDLVFSITYSDDTKKEKRFSKAEVLPILIAFLKNPDTLAKSTALINAGNFDKILNSYRQTSHLDSEALELANARSQKPRKEGQALALEAELSMIGTDDSGTDTTVASTDKTQAGKDAPESKDQVINYNEGETSSAFIEAKIREVLASEEDIKKVSSTKALIEFLPHIRFILGQPDLNEKSLVNKRKEFTETLQQQADINRLREAFRADVLQAKTVSLRNYLATPNGENVRQNLEALTYETIAHAFGQIKHQISKGKQANQTEIDGQIRIYQKTTQALTAIARKLAQEAKLKKKDD